MWQEIKKEEEEERLASLTQGGILHFRNNEGVFKVKGTVSRDGYCSMFKKRFKKDAFCICADGLKLFFLDIYFKNFIFCYYMLIIKIPNSQSCIGFLYLNLNYFKNNAAKFEEYNRK